MPRYEVIAATRAAEIALEHFYQETGKGSSCFDLCATCASKVRPWTSLDDIVESSVHYFKERAFFLYQGEPSRDDYGVQGDVEHPTYTDDNYKCSMCGAMLTEKDD